MLNPNDKIEELKLNLKTAIRRKIKNEILENSLCTTERSMEKERSLIRTEKEFMMQQFEELKQQISQKKYQIAMINIWNTSEKVKIESHLTNVYRHKQDFNTLFKKEREISELHNKEVIKKEAEKLEIERQKNKQLLEINEGKINAIDSESKEIELECSVLKNRNKAMMLKIRRQLMDAEVTRRLLMKKKGLGPDNN